MSTEIKLEKSMQRIYSCSLTKLKIVTWRKQIAVTILFESFVLSSFSLFTVQALLQKHSCRTVALYGLFISWQTIGLRISPYQKFAELHQEFVAPFNSNFHNKTLCESGVMWITCFVTYLSIAFHIYLLIIIHF